MPNVEQQQREKERAEAERAQRLKAERKYFESKPFEQIRREYSRNPFRMLMRLIRYILAMVLAFPGIVLYGSALFAAQNYITDEKKKKVYHYLNAFGLTPWIALHLIYVVILSLFAWLNNNGFSKDALLICESLFDNYSWLIPVCEGLMLPVFLYWFYLQITGNTIFKKGMAFTNVLVIFGILKGISMMMPESGFRLGFTNGLMSESMIIWFLLVFMEIGGRK